VLISISFQVDLGFPNQQGYPCTPPRQAHARNSFDGEGCDDHHDAPRANIVAGNSVMPKGGQRGENFGWFPKRNALRAQGHEFCLRADLNCPECAVILHVLQVGAGFCFST